MSMSFQLCRWTGHRCTFAVFKDNEMSNADGIQQKVLERGRVTIYHVSSL